MAGPADGERRLRLLVAYDGAPFSGFARQRGRRTVQGELEAALSRLAKQPVTTVGAGRTDAGVHALGQVASFEADGGPPPERAALALNGVLPDDVAAVESEAAPDGFSARFSATGRSYRYRVWRRAVDSPLERRRAFWVPRAVDEDALSASAGLLSGEHDFRAFTPTETQHEVFVRDVHAAAWESDGDRLDFTITADSFLRHMVRTLVGTMLEAGPDAPACVPGLLHTERSRSDAGLTAPPWGLYLVRVDY